MKGSSNNARRSAERLSNWAKHVERVGAEFPRGLSLLRDIENTLANLRLSQSAVELLSSVIKEETQRIVSNPPKAAIDKDGKLGAVLLGTQTQLKEHHRLLKSRCNAARADASLRPDDGVVEEYCRFITSVAELHNDLNTLRWAMAEHDAEYSKPLGSFDTTEKLFAFLNGKGAQRREMQPDLFGGLA